MKTSDVLCVIPVISKSLCRRLLSSEGVSIWNLCMDCLNCIIFSFMVKYETFMDICVLFGGCVREYCDVYIGVRVMVKKTMSRYV